MKYTRAALEGRNWHKIVYWDRKKSGYSAHAHIVCVMNDNFSDDQYLLRHGSGYTLIMLEESEDYIWLKLKLGIISRDYRGCGDWYNYRYSNGPGNRMGRQTKRAQQE